MVKCIHQNGMFFSFLSIVINTYIKDSDGNLAPYSKAAESRRLVRADADGLGALLPESASSTRKQVMKHGSPRYRAKPWLGLLSDFPLGE